MLTLLFGMLLVVLSLAWLVLRRPIGMIYHIIRTIETFGIWLLSPWGKEFQLLYKKQGNVPFWDIYLSSIPFGIILTILIGCIGYWLIQKTKRQHLSNFIAHDKNSPPDYKSIMLRQSILHPANKFFLDYNINDHTDIETGVARMPDRAMQAIIKAKAYKGTIFDAGTETLECDKDRIKNYLLPCFGEKNPFLKDKAAFLNSNESFFPADQIEHIINYDLSWHHVLIMYPAIYRIYGSLVDDGREFSFYLKSSENMLNDVWRDLNKLKSELGDSIVLGFQNEQKEEYERALFAEKHGTDKKLYSLKDYLNSENNSGKKIADCLPSVVYARTELIKLLNCHRYDPDHIPVGKDSKKGFIYKPLSQIKGSEKLFSENVQKQQKTFINYIKPMIMNHAYIATMIASFLDEKTKGARSLGVLAPAQFRWMRFYDYKLWAFLRGVGSPTPVPEASGLFQHYQDENTIEQAIFSPQVDRAIDAIIHEANNYLTPKTKETLEKSIEEEKEEEKSIE